MKSWNRVSAPRRLVIAVFVAGGTLLVAPLARAASTDIRGVSLASPPAALTVLGGGVAPLTVRNGSGVKARRVVVTIVLSKDKLRDRRDAVIGGGRFAGLPAGASRTTRMALGIGANVKPGLYWLIACATAGAQAQSTKANDCVVTSRKITVRAATRPVVPTVAALQTLAVAKALGPAGGSVTAAGVAGGSVVLTVPAKALSVSTTIRIVPVATVTPGPRGVTPIMGAILQPEGLLVPGATVAFTPPAGLPAKGLAGFTFGGEDEAIVRALFRRGKGLSLDADMFGGYGIGVPKAGLKAMAPPAAGSAATDPCAAESLRKRADEIAAAAAPRTTAEFVALAETLSQFERSSVIPAMRAAVRAGATADELSPYISLALSIERNAALLGVGGDVSIIAEVTRALRAAMEAEIKKCAEGTLGPLRTSTDYYRVARSVELLGGGSTADLAAKLDADCLSKPYLLSYEMTTDERFTTSPRPAGNVSGRVFITDLPVPLPKPGQDPVAATGPMSSSDLTCDVGAGAFVIACVVNTALVDLEAKVVRSDITTKTEQRCGRPVEVPDYKVVFQLRHPRDEQQETITVQPPTGSPQMVPASAGSGFDRALSVATEGEMQQVTLPDNGGNELLLGSTDNFHGSMLKIFASGNATLKLK